MALMQPGLETDSRWLAVIRRDATAEGRFFYAVTTTGIFCRPTCPSRRPRPENIRFFADIGSARAAGFRPCQRCHPEDTLPRGVALVQAICRRIDDSEEILSLDALAADVGLSKFHLHRLFRQHTGLTPHAYARARRTERLSMHLAQGKMSVTRAIYEAGYNSASRAYDGANTRLGMPPGQYRKGGTGLHIRFAVGGSSLGQVLAAATDKGICAILLGDDAGALVADLGRRFPNASLIGDDPDFKATLARVIAMVEAPAMGLDLPLDLRGTTFQQRVWQALMQVPPGQTVSYADIAGSIGMPKAARAVAQACGANKIAIAVPCHRVIRNDGGVSGYRWGVQRKQKLLAREADAIP